MLAARSSLLKPGRPWARHTMLALVAGMGAIGLLAGCGAGHIAQTASQVPVVPGVNANAGTINIRDVYLVAPADDLWKAGSDIPLSLRLVNSGPTSDELIGAESPAGDIELVSGSASASPSGTASVSASASPSASPSASGSASPSGSAAPSGSASPSESPAGESVPLAPSTLVALDQSGSYLVLRRSSENLRSGDTIELTLHFANAGQVTLTVPVATPESPQPRTSLTHEGDEGGH